VSAERYAKYTKYDNFGGNQMSKKEKMTMALGIGGWFLSLHFAVVIINRIVSQLAAFSLLAGTSVVDDILIRNSIMNVIIFGIPSMIMFLTGLVFLFLYNRRLKSICSNSEEQGLDITENTRVQVRFSVFSVTGILILLMSIYSVISISVLQYEAVAGLLSFKFSEPYFKYSLFLVGPRYLLSLVEGLIGLFLLIKYRKKVVRNATEDTVVDSTR
jgi:hypothetical protein